MNELAPGYATEDFPYAQILMDQTEEIREHMTGPVEAYLGFLGERDNANIGPVFDYGSSAISTAGHARLAGQQELTMRQIIQANTQTARMIAGVMHGQGTLLGKETLMSVDLGNTGWSQSEFMLYWSLVISGMDLRERAKVDGGLGQFERQFDHSLIRHDVYLGRMNDSGLPRRERWSEYEGFIHAFVEVARDTDVDRVPAHRLRSFVDPGISLGNSAETLLAAELDIPRERIASVVPAQMESAVPLPALREDLYILRAVGGSVLAAPKGAMLIPVRDDDPPGYLER